MQIENKLLFSIPEKLIKELNNRKLASYAGVAPFPYSSGTSIQGRTKVSSIANKKLKSLLSRRTAAGINKMNSINAVRNKLLARALAVVKRRTPYVKLCKYAA